LHKVIAHRDDAAEVFAHEVRVFADSLGERTEDDAGFASLLNVVPIDTLSNTASTATPADSVRATESSFSYVRSSSGSRPPALRPILGSLRRGSTEIAS
jgi:hypothetical protein